MCFIKHILKQILNKEYLMLELAITQFIRLKALSLRNTHLKFCQNKFVYFNVCHFNSIIYRQRALFKNK